MENKSCFCASAEAGHASLPFRVPAWKGSEGRGGDRTAAGKLGPQRKQEASRRLSLNIRRSRGKIGSGFYPV